MLAVSSYSCLQWVLRCAPTSLAFWGLLQSVIMHKDALGRRWQKWLNLPDVGERWPHLGRRGPARSRLQQKDTFWLLFFHGFRWKPFFSFYVHRSEVKSYLNINIWKSNTMEKKHKNMEAFISALRSILVVRCDLLVLEQKHHRLY